MSVGRTTSWPASIAAEDLVDRAHRRAPLDDAVAPGEIARRRDVRVPEVAEQRRDPRRVSRDLEHERAAGSQHVSAPRATASVAPTPTSASRGSQSRTSGSSDVDLLRQDVRRVRDDEIPGAVRETGEEIPLAQLDRQPVRTALAPAISSAPGRRVDPRDARTRMLVGDRERDRAAARSDVEDARVGESGDTREAALDDDLRLRPRNEHAPVDGQHEPAETPLAEYIRERLACLASGDEALERFLLERESLRVASSASSDRVSPSTCATRISASTRGDSQPAAASRSLVSASARLTFTRRRRRAPGAALPRGAPRSARRCRRRAPGRDGAA